MSYLAKIDNLTEFNSYIHQLEVEIGKMGGRKFKFNSETSYKMKTLVDQFASLVTKMSSSREDALGFLSAKSYLLQLENLGNDELSKSSVIVKILTLFRRLPDIFRRSHLKIINGLQSPSNSESANKDSIQSKADQLLQMANPQLEDIKKLGNLMIESFKNPNLSPPDQAWVSKIEPTLIQIGQQLNELFDFDYKLALDTFSELLTKSPEFFCCLGAMGKLNQTLGDQFETLFQNSLKS